MWHWARCNHCDKFKMVGYVACLDMELCIDCFWAWQNGEIVIRQSIKICTN